MFLSGGLKYSVLFLLCVALRDKLHKKLQRVTAPLAFAMSGKESLQFFTYNHNCNQHTHVYNLCSNFDIYKVALVSFLISSNQHVCILSNLALC